MVLDAAALQRLEEAAPEDSDGRDPVMAGGTSRIMSCAIVLLLQHEFDQPVARREECQPGAAVGGRREPRGIGRQLRQDGSSGRRSRWKRSSRWRQLSADDEHCRRYGSRP